MSYEDTIRVAELKTRASRFERVRGEVRVQGDQVLAINEYMHPRLQEICETLPAALGRWLMRSGWPRRLVERFTQQGPRRHDQLAARLPDALRGGRHEALAPRDAALRASRTRASRHWLRAHRGTAAQQPELAVEVAQCQRLVKGYSDTHERGLRNYETVMARRAARRRRAGAGHAARAARRRARRRARRQAARRAGAPCAGLSADDGRRPHDRRHSEASRRRGARAQPADPPCSACAPTTARALPGFTAGAHLRVQVELPDGSDGLAPLLADQPRRPSADATDAPPST